MEVKRFYKQTEVGSIPDDWRVAKIEDCCQIFGRIGFRGYTINDIVEERNGAIAISPSNIRNNKTDFSSCTYVS
jgi:type I restriction enzyme, S subunit